VSRYQSVPILSSRKSRWAPGALRPALGTVSAIAVIVTPMPRGHRRDGPKGRRRTKPDVNSGDLDGGRSRYAAIVRDQPTRVSCLGLRRRPRTRREPRHPRGKETGAPRRRPLRGEERLSWLDSRLRPARRIGASRRRCKPNRTCWSGVGRDARDRVPKGSARFSSDRAPRARWASTVDCARTAVPKGSRLPSGSNSVGRVSASQV
jgi:hypothetical protein